MHAPMPDVGGWRWLVLIALASVALAGVLPNLNGA